MKKNLLKKWIGAGGMSLVVLLGFAGQNDYVDERVSIANIPTGFVPAPKDLGDGSWCYVFDKPADNMVVTLRKDLVISRALVVGGGGSGGITYGGGGGGGGVWTNDVPIDVVSGATVAVAVGAGGAKLADNAPWTQQGNNGGTSQFVVGGTTYAAVGGGGGGSFSMTAGLDGANGGGGSYGGTGGQATMTGGHKGAQVVGYNGGGGGGAGVDANGVMGGEGLTNDITGVSQVYGSGGGGSSQNGVGGTNAGAGSLTSFGNDAVDGFGGGGGGGGFTGAVGLPGGKGGDGTVILVLCDPPDPELPAVHVSVETSGNYSHTVEVKVDKLGTDASSVTVSFAYGFADGPLGAYRTSAETVAAGATVSCAMTDLSAGSYRYAVKVVNDLGKEKIVEGSFLVIDMPPADATGELIGLKGDVLVIDLIRNAQGNFDCRSYKDVDMGAFNCDVYKTRKMVLRRIPAREEGYPCRPQWVGVGASALAANDVKVVHKTYGFSIFPVTREQYARVMDPGFTSVVKPSDFDYDHNYNTVRGNDTRMNVSNLTPDDMRNWINMNYMTPTDAVTPDSFMGILCAKCVDEAGLPIGEFDLPTELQWEIAARAGSFAANGSFWDKTAQMVVEGNLVNGALYTPLGAIPATVGTLAPNAWGIYDTQGAYWEMCLDVFNDTPATTVEEAVVTPVMPDNLQPPTLNYKNFGRYEIYGGERVVHGNLAAVSSLPSHHPSLRSFWRATDPTYYSSNPQAGSYITYRVRCYFEEPPRVTALWITDHADAGARRVHLEFEPTLADGVKLTANNVRSLASARRIRVAFAKTEADLEKAELRVATLRDPTARMSLEEGRIWITAEMPTDPVDRRICKIVILNAVAE